MNKKITLREIRILQSLKGGGDVFYPEIVLTCRKLEKLGLLTVCEPMGTYPGRREQPLIGAIATGKGKDFLEAKVSS